MSIRNQRTRRHEDDFPSRLARGEATVGELMEHAQEIIVETPEAFGTDTSETVRLLLVVINALSGALDVQQHHNIRELDLEQR